jgi:transposase
VTSTAVAVCDSGVEAVRPANVPSDVVVWASGKAVVGKGALWTVRSALDVPATYRHGVWSLKYLTGRQRPQLDWIAKTDPRLWRAYLLKEGLRYVFAVKGDEGKQALDRWTTWARRSRISAFVHLQRKIAAHRPAIDAALDTRLSQGLVESTNTKIRLLTRIAFGFHGHEPLVALAMLALGSHPPHLPGRN